MMATRSTNELAELISRKHQVLGQLRNVGVEQIDLVERGEVSALLKVLAAKQQLITNLQGVEQELAPFREDDPDSRQWPTPAARAECAQQAAECNELLNEVVYLEKQSEDKMIARRNQVADQLQRVYSAVQARGAYAAQQYAGARQSRANTSTPIENTQRRDTQSENASGGLNLISDK